MDYICKLHKSYQYIIGYKSYDIKPTIENLPVYLLEEHNILLQSKNIKIDKIKKNAGK